MADKNMSRYSENEIKNLIDNKKYQPTKVDASEYNIDADFWEDVEIVEPAGKKSVRLNIDEDVFNWFKSQGTGHITRMQSVLRSFYEARSK